MACSSGVSGANNSSCTRDMMASACWWMASPSSVRKSWKLRWSLGLRSRRTRFLPSRLADLPGDQCLVAAHLASQVLQVQPALFVDKLQYMDVGRGQVESLAIELALDARPHMLEDRHQRGHQVGIHGVVHWFGRVNLM